jgi:hypothetical protein
MRRCAIKRTAPSISYGPESSKTITVDAVSATNYLEGCFSARSSSNGAITIVPTPCAVQCLPQRGNIFGRHNGALVAPTRALVIDHCGDLIILELVGEGRHGGGIHDPGDGFSL